MGAFDGIQSGVSSLGNDISSMVESYKDLERMSTLQSTGVAGEDIMGDIINKSLPDNGVLRYFNRMLMGYEIDGQIYSPDINGYTFIFVLPPHLSGYSATANSKIATNVGSELSRIGKLFAFLAIDSTPPPTSVVTSSVDSRSGSITYGAEVHSSGQFQITFLDNSNLDAFGYHKTWVSYIENVSRGIVEPDARYLDPGSTMFGEIDYATSAYIARFKPSVGEGWGDLVYIGKAVGIFPIDLPDKEVIGRRDSNQITMLPITYACTFYRQCVYGSPAETNNWIYDELQDLCLKAYASGGVGGLDGYGS